MQEDSRRKILWWGRYDSEYSRNRILKSALKALGWDCVDFKPWTSATAYIEALLRRPDEGFSAIWVPAFRHNDMQAAKYYSRKLSIPLIFDPLISAWDKQVFERGKFGPESFRGKQLLKRERKIYALADVVIADTELHARFYRDVLKVPIKKLAIVPVGAEEEIFTFQSPDRMSKTKEVLFYGSFIGLQGPEVIAQAANLAPEIRWTMLGAGPLKQKCKEICSENQNVKFEDWLAYESLPERIGRASILLGIFGTTEKPARVIPNKVYQALACGRVVITRESNAYPERLAREVEQAVSFVKPGSPEAIVEEVRMILSNQLKLRSLSHKARKEYDYHFSNGKIKESLLRFMSKHPTLVSV